MRGVWALTVAYIGPRFGYAQTFKHYERIAKDIVIAEDTYATKEQILDYEKGNAFACKTRINLAKDHFPTISQLLPGVCFVCGGKSKTSTPAVTPNS